MTDAFRYVDDPHGYFFGAEPVPSPSSVFQDLGLVDPRWFTEDSRARGRAAHAWIAEAIAGRSYAGADAEIKLYVESGLRFYERRKPKIIRLETPLYHNALRFAGTSDADWELDGWRWIIDWKTGKASKVVRYQTAAYEMLARYAYGGLNVPIWKRAAVELQADGSIANLVRYDDHTDGAGWLNLLGSYNIRKALRASGLVALPQGEETYVANH